MSDAAILDKLYQQVTEALAATPVAKPDPDGQTELIRTVVSKCNTLAGVRLSVVVSPDLENTTEGKFFPVTIWLDGVELVYWKISRTMNSKQQLHYPLLTEAEVVTEILKQLQARQAPK